MVHRRLLSLVSGEDIIALYISGDPARTDLVPAVRILQDLASGIAREFSDDLLIFPGTSTDIQIV